MFLDSRQLQSAISNDRGRIMNHKQKYLTETNTIHGNGVQKVYKFPNGYGASVVKHEGSYGGKSGLWELAVLKDDEICYTTNITSDVMGHLNDPQVDAVLKQIKLLSGPKEGSFYGYNEKTDNYVPGLDD
jgi:hypothetical protein